jgi:lipopolysaccharide export system protein LptA
MKMLIISLILFAVFCSAYAEPVVLKYADQLIGSQIGAENTRTLLGNVVLQQRNVIVKCNSAVQYMYENRFLLTGNVVITQDSLTLKSNSVVYDGNTYLATSNEKVEITDGKQKLIGDNGNYSTNSKIASFSGNVILENDSLVVLADNVVYDRNTTNSKAFGNTIAKNKPATTFLQCDTLINLQQQNTQNAIGHPILLMLDSTTDGYDTLTVQCSDSIIAKRNDTNENYLFIGNVEFVGKGLSSKSKLAVYDKKSENIILHSSESDSSDVVLWLDSTQLSADSVFIQLANNKIQNIRSYRDCIATSTSDSTNTIRINQLAGDSITMFIRNDSLNKIISNGNAKSLFFLTTENKPDGLIENSAETIIIDVADNKPNEITFVKQVPGKYYPEPLIHTTAKEHYLPNYRRYLEIPVRPTFQFK